MAGGAGGEGPTASGSALCPSTGPSQGQCPHTTFTVVFTGSPTQRSVRKPTSSQLLQGLLPKARACQSSQDTTRGLPYVADIKNLESNCHAHSSHYRNTGPEEPPALTTPAGRAKGRDTGRPRSAKFRLQGQPGQPAPRLGAAAISVKLCPTQEGGNGSE